MELFYDIVPKILKRYSHVKFGMYCSEHMMTTMVEAMDLDPERVLFVPPRSFHDYPGGLAYFDINLVPTVNCRFNSSKSNLKCVETGFRGIPSVVSKLPPYVTTVRHQRNGMVGMTYENVSYLIENDKERERMGQTMKEVVEENFLMSKNCHLWPKAWDRIISGKSKSNHFPVLYGNVGRNDLCPCGDDSSGKRLRYKSCQCYPAWS